MKYSFWKFVGVIVLSVCLFSVSTMLLWNWLMPRLFDTPVINFWEAAGLLILARLLFGWSHFKSHHPHHAKSKWHKMTPEERQAFCSKFKRAFHQSSSHESTTIEPEDAER
jgi:hypothetical protein